MKIKSIKGKSKKNQMKRKRPKGVSEWKKEQTNKNSKAGSSLVINPEI